MSSNKEMETFARGVVSVKPTREEAGGSKGGGGEKKVSEEERAREDARVRSEEVEETEARFEALLRKGRGGRKI